MVNHARRVAERFNALPPGAVRDAKRLMRAPQREQILADHPHRGRVVRRAAAAAPRRWRPSWPSSRSASPTSASSELAPTPPHRDQLARQPRTDRPHVADRQDRAHARCWWRRRCARARAPHACPRPAGERHGVVGEGPPLRLLIAGDSSAAGVGVAHAARGAGRAAGRRLAQRCARAGALAAGGALGAQLGADAAPAAAREPAARSALRPGGGRHRRQRRRSTRCPRTMRCRRARRSPTGCATRLGVRARGVHAAAADARAFRRLPQPLRWVAGSDADAPRPRARALGAPRAATSRAWRCRCRSTPALMAADGFHPGAPVYRRVRSGGGRRTSCAISRRCCGRSSPSPTPGDPDDRAR
ncbi:MAG: hypothetical protein MZW92_30740 [Comamonadaceae bacterium]|nr:hypothetical protein [Comamonadaceae bacterium]